MRLAVPFAAALIACITAPALAQSPKPVPMPPAVAAPKDIPYKGTIGLDVDATDVTRGIFRVHETVPVSAGPLTLLYPRWLPGDHSPSGQIEKFTGLVVTANGQPLAWKRDVVDIAAFHIDVPKGVTSLDLAFQFVSATDDSQGPVLMVRDAMQLEWNLLLLYPAGHYATQVKFAPRLKLPEGWAYATALGNGTASAAPVSFPDTDLSTLVDSPLFAGRYSKRIDLDPGGRSPVFLNVFAEKPDALAATDEQIAKHRALIKQADLLYGARHFDHYDFLLSLSDNLQNVGLEHHRSSENDTPPCYFKEWSDCTYERDLLAHEMTHSWNGKYRRPADLWTPNFNVPMRDSLLWVYEGQTQFWGQVLAARSGLFTKEEAMDSLAGYAATYSIGTPGRKWRPLEDTTNDPVIADRPPQAWRSWQRSEDYYNEGLLIWLDADTLIREKTGDKKSLDDFAKAFFGQHDGVWTPDTYTFDDVVKTLNGVLAYDWASFLRARLDAVTPNAPLDGFARAGWRLVFTEERGDFLKALETEFKRSDFTYSLGFGLGEGGKVRMVLWDGLAFNQGLAVGAKIIAVNGEAFDVDTLRDAITDAKAANSKPIDLLIQTGDRFRTIQFDYHGGLRYPHLERIPGTPDRLTTILSAK